MKSTITRVAEDLGEDEDRLREFAIEMEIEDRVIWVYGVEEDGVQAFTDFGVENLIELVRFYKENPDLLRRLIAPPAVYADGVRSSAPYWRCSPTPRARWLWSRYCRDTCRTN